MSNEPILSGVDSVGTISSSLVAYAAVQALQPDLIINAGTAGGFKVGSSPLFPGKIMIITLYDFLYLHLFIFHFKLGSSCLIFCRILSYHLIF